MLNRCSYMILNVSVIAIKSNMIPTEDRLTNPSVPPGYNYLYMALAWLCFNHKKIRNCFCIEVHRIYIHVYRAYV